MSESVRLPPRQEEERPPQFSLAWMMAVVTGLALGLAILRICGVELSYLIVDLLWVGLYLAPACWLALMFLLRREVAKQRNGVAIMLATLPVATMVLAAIALEVRSSLFGVDWLMLFAGWTAQAALLGMLVLFSGDHLDR